ncbi:hypothetical protein GTR02_01940 [Kineococcus sp. R8]|nr:hypothetical protein [Kineococcus siccus]
MLGVLAGLAVAALWLVPEQLNRRAFSTPAERAVAVNAARIPAAAVFAAAIAALGVWVNHGNVTVARVALKQTRSRDLETTRLTEAAQRNDRFVRAIELINDDQQLNARLGGLYALEQLMRESPKIYYATIVDVLAAYIRHRAPWPPQSATEAIRAESYVPRWRRLMSKHTPRPFNDVQVALTILGRRAHLDSLPASDRGNLDHHKIDLSGTNLRGADLTDAYLVRVDLSRSHLEGANLRRACLTAANLHEAHLTTATLDGADLRKARLTGTRLQGARLNGALLQQVDLHDRQLLGTRLNGAHLEGANLRGAWMGFAELRGAHLQGADLTAAGLSSADLRGADLTEAILTMASLNNCVLTAAKVKNADFTSAKLFYAELTELDMGQAELGGAQMIGAAFGGTQLVETKGLTWGQVMSIQGDGRTTLPSTLRGPNGELRPNHWPAEDHNRALSETQT